jgi:hypothetical protein
MSVDRPPSLSMSQGNRLLGHSVAKAEMDGWTNKIAAPHIRVDPRTFFATNRSGFRFVASARQCLCPGTFSQPATHAPVTTGINGDNHTSVVHPAREARKIWQVMTPPSVRGANRRDQRRHRGSGATSLSPQTVAPFSYSTAIRLFHSATLCPNSCAPQRSAIPVIIGINGDNAYPRLLHSLRLETLMAL